MKKANPLQGIPQVPKTVAGQWLAFSHMANHYRRLLNVKPRVDTSAPKTGSTHCLATKGNINTNSKNYVKKKVSGSSKYEVVENPPKTGRTKQTQEAKSKHKNNAVKRSSKTNRHRDSVDSDYQLLGFGPPSTKSSVDAALVSDSESYEEPSPRVKPMGIAEKIRMFLDNAQGSMGGPPKSSLRKGRKAVESKHDHVQDNSRLRLERHSRCFEPTEINRPIVAKCQPSPIQCRKNESLKILYHHRNGKTSGPKGAGDVSGAGSSKRNSTVQQIIESSWRRTKQLERHRDSNRGGSAHSASVGTIRGSDDLTEEPDLHVMPKSPHSNRYTGIDVEPQKLSKWMQHEKIERRNNETVVSGSSNGHRHNPLGKATSISNLALGLVNNKDSSRDSAYGFSSGESRITTRESTPEHTNANTLKKSNKRKGALEVNGKYKSSLSTVASSVNQDTSPVNSSRFSNDCLRGFTNKTTDIVPRWANEEKYVGFLTEVTNDVVNRGIYTNKGLKSLFNNHLEKNMHLEREKMMLMLDRLRIDVGIPKDDNLNQLEFGYGSVKYTSGPFFATSTETESTLRYTNPPSNANDIRQDMSSNSSAYSKQSGTDHLVFSNHKRSSNTPIDDGKGSSYSVSGNSREDSASEQNLANGNDESNFEASSQSSRSSFNISENEMKTTLRNIGFDSLTAMEIVDIVASESNSRTSHLSLSKSKNEISLHKSKSNHNYLPVKSKSSHVSNVGTAAVTSHSHHKVDKLKVLHRSCSQQSLGSC